MPLEDPRDAPDLLLKSAFYSARPGMALVDPRGQFMRINPALCQIVGYDEAEFRKLTFQEITHSDDLEPDLENLERLIRGETSGYEMEKRYFRKNGSIVWIQLNVAAMRDNSGQPICFAAQIQDLTKRKEEEAKLTEELMQWVVEDEPDSDLPDSEPGIRILKVVRALCREPSLLRQKVSEVALAKLLTNPASGDKAGSEAHLTQRELKVLMLVAKGKTSKEIASELGISPRTVEVHRASITRKLKARQPTISVPPLLPALINPSAAPLVD